jgi:polysaccharide export outer membrane protein
MTGKPGNVAVQGPMAFYAMLAFCVLLAPALAQGQVAAGQSQSRAVANYVVQSGDVLSVLIWGWPTAADKVEGRFPIEADGKVYLPVVGAVEVAGKTTERVQADLRQRLASEQRQAVIVIEPMFAVAVNGEVGLPSVYDFRPGQTVFDAISRAGGFTQDSDREKVLLVRDGNAQMLTAESAGQLAALLAQTPLKSGDRLLVDARRRVGITTILNVLQTAIAAVTLYAVLK